MSYIFKYLNPSDFKQKNRELCETDKIGISADNAKRVGIICLRAIQAYKDTQDGYRKEKSNLKIWVRDQRSSARSHGRIFSYKGASKTRASLNASISNTNDSILNQIDSMVEISESNVILAKNRLSQCLRYVELSEIRLYEPIYLESKAQKEAYENLKSSKTLLYFSIFASPIAFIFVASSLYSNVLLIAFLVISITGAWIYFALRMINFLDEKIGRFEKAEKSVQLLKQTRELRKQEEEIFIGSVNSETSQCDDDEIVERQKSRIELNRELAKHLKEEYVTFENACLSLEIDASNWMDLAEKVNSIEQDDSSDISIDKIQTSESLGVPADFRDNDSDEKGEAVVYYTVDRLRSEFSSFKDAKDFFGVSAKSWESLAHKLNIKRGI